MALSENRVQKNAENIGTILKDAREKAGFTQKALADAIGLEYYTMISQMERGYVTVPVTLWHPLALSLGLDPVEFSLRCLLSYQPDLFNAVFGNRGRSEVERLLTAFRKGQLNDFLSKPDR